MRDATPAKENPSDGGHRALGCVLNPFTKEIHMPKIRPIRRAFNHADLPLFRFAIERLDCRRMTHTARWVRRRYRVESPALANTIALLAGFNAEGETDA